MTSTFYSPGTVVSSTWLNDADTATYNYLTSVAGTNTITATGPVSMLSYTAGDRFYFTPAVTNTGAVTINISGLGVQPITKNGSNNLIAGDLRVGNVHEIVYDGSLFQLINPGVISVANGGTGVQTAAAAPWQAGRLLNVQVFVASGTYTPTAGTTTVIVECVGGGGAGGGANATPAGQISAGSGGGSGAHTLGRIANTISQAITVGAGGIGVSAGNGGNGGTSSFGALITAPGGGGGIRAVAAAQITAGGGVGANTGIGGNLYAAPGTEGGWLFFTQPTTISGTGAPGPWGGGAGTSGGGNAGKPGLGIGSGGGGAANSQSDATLRTGGNGASGVVIVYEYT